MALRRVPLLSSDHTENYNKHMFVEPGLNLGSVPASLHSLSERNFVVLCAMNAGFIHVLDPTLSLGGSNALDEDENSQDSDGTRESLGFNLPALFLGVDSKLPWLDWNQRVMNSNFTHMWIQNMEFELWYV